MSYTDCPVTSARSDSKWRVTERQTSPGGRHVERMRSRRGSGCEQPRVVKTLQVVLRRLEGQRVRGLLGSSTGRAPGPAPPPNGPAGLARAEGSPPPQPPGERSRPPGWRMSGVTSWGRAAETGEGVLTSESTPSHGLRPFPNPKLPGLHPPSPASLPPPNTTLYTDYSRLPSQGSPGLPRSLAKLESTRNRRGLRRSGPPAKSPPHPSLQGGRGSQRQQGQRWLARKRTCSLTWTLGLDRSRGLAGVAASTHPRPETPSPEAGRGEGQRLLIGPARRPAIQGCGGRGPSCQRGRCSAHLGAASLGPGRTPERQRGHLCIVFTLPESSDLTSVLSNTDNTPVRSIN